MAETGRDPEREPAGRPAKPARPAPDQDETYDDSVDWADEAATARTTDDPRRRAPHDESGVPSADGSAD